MDGGRKPPPSHCSRGLGKGAPPVTLHVRVVHDVRTLRGNARCALSTDAGETGPPRAPVSSRLLLGVALVVDVVADLTASNA